MLCERSSTEEKCANVASIMSAKRRCRRTFMSWMLPLSAQSDDHSVFSMAHELCHPEMFPEIVFFAKQACDSAGVSLRES